MFNLRVYFTLKLKKFINKKDYFLKFKILSWFIIHILVKVLKLLKARKQHGGTYDGLDLRHSRRRTCGSISSVPSSVSSRPIRNNRSQTRGKVRDFKVRSS